MYFEPPPNSMNQEPPFEGWETQTQQPCMTWEFSVRSHWKDSPCCLDVISAPWFTLLS